MVWFQSTVWFALLGVSVLQQQQQQQQLVSGFMIARPYVGVTTTRSSGSGNSNSNHELSMAGFGKSSGGGGGMKKTTTKKKKKNVIKKLKPKAQWDKYCQLKSAQGINVAVRVVSTKTNNDWIMVGRVKSENDSYTPQAVLLQRAIIAEHSKRLYPLQVRIYIYIYIYINQSLYDCIIV